jgi:hypothetical protein
MSKLTKLLEIGFAGNSERSRIINKPSTKKIVGDKDYKALLKSDASESTTLIQEEVFRTISEGAEPWKCMRDILPIINTDSYSVRIVKGETGSYADELAEGAKVPVDTQSYSKEDISIKKIGTRPLITNELIEDGLFDVAELELKKAGARIENKLNRDAILEVLTDASSNETDPSSHIDVATLAKARGEVAGNNYMPDTAIFHPTAEAYLLQDSNLVYASYAGGKGTLTSGNLPTILGLKPYTLSVSTGSDTYHWDGTDGSHHCNGVVLDSNANTYLAMRRDLTVEEYDDPIHDLVGISTTMRYGVSTIQADAAELILAK